MKCRNNFDFRNTAFIILSDEQLNTKIEALKKYKSQQHRSYANEKFIRSLATVRGTQVGKNMPKYLKLLD